MIAVNMSRNNLSEWQEVGDTTEAGGQASLFGIRAFGINLQSERQQICTISLLNCCY